MGIFLKQFESQITMKPTILLSLLLIVLQVHNGHGGKDLLHGQLASSISDFAFKFSKHVASHQGARNIFFSPVSISMAFSLIGMGAKSNTQKQIYKGLELSKMDSSKIHAAFQEFLKIMNDPTNTAIVNMGNGLYLAKGIKIATKYNKDLQNFYRSEIYAVDFKDHVAAERRINKFVKDNTRGKIPEVVRNIDPNSRMVLVNYIYFKDHWEIPFDPQFTKKRDFFVNEKTTVKVDMMYRNDYIQYIHDERLHCWVIQLPYGGGAVAWFILPDKGKLKNVEDSLRGEVLSKWSKSFQKGNKVSLAMPKLSISTSYDLKDLLSGLGISDVFTTKADLTGIAAGGRLEIDKASHKAVLDINERGTEAAAAVVTSIGVGAALGPPPITVTFNRPYFFILMASVDGPMLFMGKIVNPLQP